MSSLVRLLDSSACVNRLYAIRADLNYFICEKYAIWFCVAHTPDTTKTNITLLILKEEKRRRRKKRDEWVRVCGVFACGTMSKVSATIRRMERVGARVWCKAQNSFSQLFFVNRVHACNGSKSLDGCLKRRRPHFSETLNASMWRCVYAQRAHAFFFFFFFFNSFHSSLGIFAVFAMPQMPFGDQLIYK